MLSVVFPDGDLVVFGPTVAEQGSVGLGGLPHPLSEGLTAWLYGQLGSQGVQISPVQVRRHPAAQGAHLGGHLGGDVGVAVPVTSHPGAKADGGAGDR